MVYGDCTLKACDSIAGGTATGNDPNTIPSDPVRVEFSLILEFDPFRAGGNLLLRPVGVAHGY